MARFRTPPEAGGVAAAGGSDGRRCARLTLERADCDGAASGDGEVLTLTAGRAGVAGAAAAAVRATEERAAKRVGAPGGSAAGPVTDGLGATGAEAEGGGGLSSWGLRATIGGRAADEEDRDSDGGGAGAGDAGDGAAAVGAPGESPRAASVSA